MWYHKLNADPNVEIREKTEVYSMRVREAADSAERQRLWDIALVAYHPYQENQDKTDRVIPVSLPETVA